MGVVMDASRIEHLTVEGRSVPMEVTAPATGLPVPAILLLHGSDGLIPPRDSEMAVYVKALAEAGYAVVLPHYLHGFAFGSGKEAIIAVVGEHAKWRKVTQAVFEYIRNDSRFDSSKLAAAGFSLGANMAIGLSMANPSPKLQAVASFFAPISVPSPGTSWTTVPPILLLHSKKDGTVPFDEMQFAVTFLKAAGKVEGRDFQVVEYEGNQHSLVEPDLTKSIAELLGFLKARLGV